MRRAAFVLTATLTLFAGSGVAQESARRAIRDSQLRLEQIRAERARLQAQMDSLRSRVRDSSRELANIERQRIASSKALRELEFQSETLAQTVEETTNKRGETQARLIERQVALKQRLRAIYKRGTLHTAEVLLTAESFGDLLARYKYLRMIAIYERRLLDDVSQLEGELTLQEQQLRENLTQLDVLREEKTLEVDRLRQIERQASQALKDYRSRERVAQGRLQELARDEAAVNSAILALERRRRDAESGVGPEREASLTTRDLGALNWPVEGQLLFRFGPERKPNGVVLRYNGIGIAAPAGTPVKAVESGVVQLARSLEGYGLSVVVSHGAGAYSLYLRLKQIAVREGQTLTAGQVVGTVGGEATEHGPHLEFQVRLPTNGTPTAVDPLDWLRSRQ